jgi:hypothetical protein
MARRRGEGGASCCERGRRHATVGPRCLARAYPICLCGDGLYATAALRGAPRARGARAAARPPASWRRPFINRYTSHIHHLFILKNKKRRRLDGGSLDYLNIENYCSSLDTWMGCIHSCLAHTHQA